MSASNRARKSTGTRATPTANVPDGMNMRNQSNQPVASTIGAPRQRAKKSTGSPQRQSQRATGSQRNFSVNSSSSTLPLRSRRVSSDSNSTLLRTIRPPSSSSDSDIPTQRLRVRNRSTDTQSTPGPSGISSQATNSRRLSSTDSDPDDCGPPNKRNFRRKQPAPIVQREESTSETTSDSDEIPGRENIEKENNRRTKVKRKKTKAVPPPIQSKKNISRRQPAPSESDEDTTLPSVRQNSTQPTNIASLVNKCVYFLLIADQKKHAIKKQEILKQVFTNQQQKSKLYADVMDEANEVLKKTYGMEIVKLENRKTDYLLINVLNRDLGVQEFVDLTPIELQKQGLVFYLLTIIFMNENSISEGELGEALKPLGIDMCSRTPHPIFGDVRKYLTSELVKQMYLEHKCICKDPPEFEFSWGVRAKQEVDKKDLLEFACRIMSDTKPEEWILQYNDSRH